MADRLFVFDLLGAFEDGFGPYTVDAHGHVGSALGRVLIADDFHDPFGAVLVDQGDKSGAVFIDAPIVDTRFADLDGRHAGFEARVRPCSRCGRPAGDSVDLPLHVHEHSDRAIIVADGLGLFHYVESGRGNPRLHSIVVQAGDAVLFSRGLIHTFTSPIYDLVLLSYHAPHFDFEDSRQFTISEVSIRDCYGRMPGSIQPRMHSQAASKIAR